MKRALYVTIAAAIAGGCGSEPRGASSSEAAAVVAVAVSRVESVDLPARFEAGGIVQAGATAQVTSRVVAPIASVPVRAGDHVREGQTLVVLDARELTANAERAAAALISATEALRATESRIVVAEAGLRLATATHARISALHDKRSATPQELDQAEAARAAAEAQLQAARSESAAATAASDAARAAADAASVSKSYSVLTAPFDGIVSARMVDPGSLAAPGVPLVVVEQAGLSRLEVRLDQSRAGFVSPGQQVEVGLDAQRADSWIAATIVEVARTDPSSQSFIVKVELPRGTTARTGSFGRARFEGPARRTLVVPSSGVVRRGGLTFVFTVDGEQRARLRPVVAGTVDGDRTEILSGVREGEAVVTNPPPSLTDGHAVTVGAHTRQTSAPERQP